MVEAEELRMKDREQAVKQQEDSDRKAHKKTKVAKTESGTDKPKSVP